MDPSRPRYSPEKVERWSTTDEQSSRLISSGLFNINRSIYDEAQNEPFSPMGRGMPPALPHARALQRDILTQNWVVHRGSGDFGPHDSTTPWVSSETASNYSTTSLSSSINNTFTQTYPAQFTGHPASDQIPDRRWSLTQQHGEPFPAQAGMAGPSSDRATPTHQRRPSGRDEFDGPVQFLHRPNDCGVEPAETDLPILPTTLLAQEQDEILGLVNDRLSQCAFDFVAKYQFPVPVEPDKRPVQVPGDREWSEWVFLLKRLATKRRIPARLLYNRQIKQLITILENSLEMRHAAKHQSRPLKDDRNVLQLVSSGIQVAKILKDAPAMIHLDALYMRTENIIARRRLVLYPVITAT